MSARTLNARLARADRPGDCNGKATSVVIRRGDRETRRDGPPCPLCGRRHLTTVTVVRDPNFFQRVPA